jgi:hypothetical protein
MIRCCWVRKERKEICSNVYHRFFGPDKKTPPFLIINLNPNSNSIVFVGSDLQSVDTMKLQHTEVLDPASVDLLVF